MDLSLKNKLEPCCGKSKFEKISNNLHYTKILSTLVNLLFHTISKDQCDQFQSLLVIVQSNY
ncbi:unnamed protein product [Paramecium sonneborni]|uniref:Uncharacterized protein n=1 Tax=Paramecium sonneborni TaxID=65129 RepID=A0A8S1QC73_9CILI|nr:unnamed protein product [Paramecium sonneborni]